MGETERLTVDAIAGLQAENERLLHENIVLRTKYDNTVDAFTKYGCKIAILTKRMEKIRQIVNNYDGSIPSMIKQFSEIQKVLGKE
jgi:hypothetical protein